MAPDDTHRIGIRFPTELHGRVADQADRQNMSINEWVNRAVQAVFDAHDRRQQGRDEPAEGQGQ